MNRTNTPSRSENRASRARHVPRDHYQDVTDRIIAALEAGTPPWRRPWDPDKAGGPAVPRNAATGQRYRGINTLILGMSSLAFTSGDPRWATYKQSEERGWQVRKGEHGTTGFFFRRLEIRDDTKPEDDEDSVRRIPLLRAFTLFHASQIDGIPDYVPPTIEEAPWRAPEAAEIIIANSDAVVRFGGDRAFYSPTTDHIQMPPQSAFATSQWFCGTLMHECCHNADLRIMPRRRLNPRNQGHSGATIRHNQRASRNASSLSSGRYLPGLDSGAVTSASAFSLRRKSACI
jgi:antirestriction protein ArdC